MNRVFSTSPADGCEWVLTTEYESTIAVYDWALERSQGAGLWPLELELLDHFDNGGERAPATMPWMNGSVLVFRQEFADSLGGVIREWGHFGVARADGSEYLIMRPKVTIPRTLWEGRGVTRYSDGRILAVEEVYFPDRENLPATPFLLESYERAGIWVPQAIAELLMDHGASGTKFVEN